MSDMHTIRKDEDRELQLRTRDAETQIVLGAFVLLLSLPVIAGTFWADRFNALVVNLGAGFVLLLVGLAIFSYGLYRYKRLPKP